MTTSAQISPAIDKLITNLTRIDGLVNGNASATVATDNGVLPSFAKLQATLTQNNSGPVSLTSFGAVGDGVTDNAAALAAFGVWARAQSAAGKGVDLYVPPGTYNFDHSQCQQFLVNIATLHIVGYGAHFQNTYDRNVHGANASFEWAWSPAAAPIRDAAGNLKSWLINTTAVGDTTVTTTTHADASSSNFTVGDWIMVSSLDIQYYGLPPNNDQFDFVKVVSVNSSTGVIQLDRAVRYAHRSDFPDGGNVNAVCGRARVWQLNTSGWPVVGRVSWDLDHTYEGFTIGIAPNSPTTYQILTGRRIRTINWGRMGHSESLAHTIIHENGQFDYQPEPDKLVERISYINCTWTAGVVFQSSSINTVSFINPNIVGGLNMGAKSVTVDGGSIDVLSPGGTYGMSRSVAIRGCRVASYPFPRSPLTVQPLGQLDGSNVAFANGVFTILKSGGAQTNGWGVVPGQQVILTTTGIAGTFGGDLATGTITGITEDSTNIYVKTTLPYTSLPSWAATGNNAVYIVRVGTTRVEACGGCDNVMLSSRATQLGYEEWEYLKYRWMGVTASAGFWTSFYGKLVGLTVNVIQPAPIGSCTLLLEDAGLNSPTDLTGLGDFKITIDISTKGKRVLTTQAWTGKQAADSMTLNAVSQSVLPDGYGQEYFWFLNGYTPGSYQPYQLPIIEVEFIFDYGQFRKGVTAMKDVGGNTIAAITGTLPY